MTQIVLDTVLGIALFFLLTAIPDFFIYFAHILGKSLHHASIEEYRRKYDRDLEASTQALKKLHERKLKELNKKLEQVTMVRAEHNDAKVQELAKSMTERELNKQREHYESKMMRYKHALRDIFEREKTMENQVAIQRSTSQKADLENNKLSNKIREYEVNNQELMHTLTSIQNNLACCEKELGEERTIVAALHMEVKRKDEYIANITKECNDKHAQELEKVDAKVRSALKSKQETIAQLLTQNATLLKEQEELKFSLQNVFR